MALRADFVTLNTTSGIGANSSPRKRSWGRMVSLRNVPNLCMSLDEIDSKISGQESSGVPDFSLQNAKQKTFEDMTSVSDFRQEFCDKVFRFSVDIMETRGTSDVNVSMLL